MGQMGLNPQINTFILNGGLGSPLDLMNLSNGRLMSSINKRPMKITGDRDSLSRRNGRNVAISYFIKERVEENQRK